MHSNTQAYALGLPLSCYAPYADLLEPDVCGEESEANSVFDIESKMRLGNLRRKLSDALVLPCP